MAREQGISRVTGSLWTPEGEKLLRQQDIIPLTREELIMLSHLHEWAFKYQLTIVCKRCNAAVTGKNNDGDIKAGKAPSVSCQCREWVYPQR